MNRGFSAVLLSDANGVQAAQARGCGEQCSEERTRDSLRSVAWVQGGGQAPKTVPVRILVQDGRPVPLAPPALLLGPEGAGGVDR